MKSLLSVFFGCSMLLMLGSGLVVSVFTPGLWSGFELEHDPGRVLSGEWMHSYQNAFELQSPIRDASLGLWGSLRYGLFGEGLQGVLVGARRADGSRVLFTAEEFETAGDREREIERIESSVKAVARVRTRLAEYGAELVVLPVPAKARVYWDYLGGYALPPEVGARYASWYRTLQQQGIPVVDTYTALSAARAAGEQVFLNTDTHWTPNGAGAAAEALALLIGERGFLEGAPGREYRLHETGLREHTGDLLSFLPMWPFRGRLQPPPDTIATLELEAGPQAPLGLFDLAPVPVVLVGTSYSAGEAWAFDAFLQKALQIEVLNLAEEGQGPVAPMAAYLASDTLREAPPLVVVWEIPERYLPVSDFSELLH